jgi:hypothetical protein
MRIASGLLTLLVVFGCSKGVNLPTSTSAEVKKGDCAGCLLKPQENLFSFVAQTAEDYEKLTAICFFERLGGDQLPPRPRAGEMLIYVSLEGGGCKGCLQIANVRRSSREVVVTIEGGFEGNCDMLIDLGAWVIIPRTVKPVTFQFIEVHCPER